MLGVPSEPSGGAIAIGVGVVTLITVGYGVVIPVTPEGWLGEDGLLIAEEFEAKRQELFERR